MLKTGGWSRL